MAIKKTDGILYIYDRLLSGKTINTSEMAEKFDSSTKTILRYIKDIKIYMDKEKKGLDIKYSKKKSSYFLQHLSDEQLTKQQVLAISKILLESRSLKGEELNKVINNLIKGCTYEDKTYIKKIIGNELNNYIGPQHNLNLIDDIWKLSQAIIQQEVIEISYRKIGKNGKLEDHITKRIVYPQGLLFSEYYFYLLAFIEGKDFDYPAIYRLDRISHFSLLERNFRINYDERFEDGQFRKNIHFMQTGELKTVKFIFRGKSIEAILDRLPTAEILQENDGEYLIKVKSFGKGIKMWLLSQGDAVEVLEPKEFREEIKSTINSMLLQYN